MQSTCDISALARDSFGEKVERGIFRPIERLLHPEREDRMQEGLGMGYEQFKAKAQKEGILMDDALCVHVVKLRATDFARHLVRGTHTQRDALDERNYHHGRTELLHLEGLVDEDSEFPGESERVIEIGLAERLSADPLAKIVSAIDLTDWLRTLTVEDVELLAMRVAGFTLEECAQATGGTTGVAFRRLRELGEGLAQRAEIPVAKKPRRPRSPSSTHQPLVS